MWWAVVSSQWSLVSCRFWLHFTLPISLFTLRFGSFLHRTNVRQSAPPSIWERAGGEGRQRRAEFVVWSLVISELPILASFHSSHLTLHSSLFAFIFHTGICPQAELVWLIGSRQSRCRPQRLAAGFAGRSIATPPPRVRRGGRGRAERCPVGRR